MKIKIEIDLKPEELQRFLGIPDVTAIREDLLQFIKEKVAADPAGFVLDNLDQLRNSRTVRRFLYGKQAEGSVRRPQRSEPQGEDDP